MFCVYTNRNGYNMNPLPPSKNKFRNGCKNTNIYSFKPNIIFIKDVGIQFECTDTKIKKKYIFNESENSVKPIPKVLSNRNTRIRLGFD